MRVQLDENVLQENTIIKLPRFRPEKPSLALSFHRWKNYGSRKLPRLHNDLARKPASIFSELEEGAKNGMETIPVGVSGMTEGDSRPQA